jgi:hypothetical protein
LLDVFLIPRGEELEHGTEVDGFFPVQIFQSFVEPGEQRVMGVAMLFRSRETMLPEQLFFTVKVHLSEVNEAFELEADIAAFCAFYQHAAQFVQGIHEDAVLVIHGLNADDALVTPRQRGQISLRNKAKNSPAGKSLNGANG